MKGIKEMTLEQLYEHSPYSLDSKKKSAVLLQLLNELTEKHRQGCPEYDNILTSLAYDKDSVSGLNDIPFIPVRMFKEYALKSVAKEEIVKTMTSSGTSGQQVSRIFLDRENVRSQTKTLAEIITSYIGKKRLPLLLFDTELIKKDKTLFSARGAGVIGFTTFGRDITYALDEKMELDVEKINTFLEKHNDEPILMFGYTFMIWQYIVRELEERKLTLPIKKGMLFHSGGWKKLKDQAVDTMEYNRRINGVLGGNVSVHNYYGMAEQLGSVYVECEEGHMHCSNYSDIIIRRSDDFSVAEVGEKGLIELLSVLPVSYPGHGLLTEDEGVILGEDDCPCGRKGKYFKIIGRVKGAEVRGCSDTYERR